MATRPGKPALEGIDPEDWNTFTTERQNGYQLVSLFGTEQEADRFAQAQVEAPKVVRPKMPSR